jgi:hypothetical protein
MNRFLLLSIVIIVLTIAWVSIMLFSGALSTPNPG